jgi:hypothetical protein
MSAELRTGAWSDREVRHLRKLMHRHAPVAVIAETLGRTPKSVEGKIKRLRLPVPRPARILGPPLPPEEMTDGQKVIDINSDFLAALAAERHDGARPC